jgi:hypothetical protein
VVKISAQSEHFSVLILKVSHSKFWLFNLFLDIWIRDPDSEYGSRPNLNADPTGSRSGPLYKVTADKLLSGCFMRVEMSHGYFVGGTKKSGANNTK